LPTSVPWARLSVKSAWTAGVPANRAICRSSAARSASPRSGLSSWVRKKPATVSAHSGRRPTIHEAASFSSAFASVSRPTTSFGSSPPPSIWSIAISAARFTIGSAEARPSAVAFGSAISINA
jgi:hypothetical protein